MKCRNFVIMPPLVCNVATSLILVRQAQGCQEGFNGAPSSKFHSELSSTIHSSSGRRNHG